MITVMPAAFKRWNIRMISRLFPESRFPVGSSASSTGGSFTIARATATRSFSPPDISPGSRSAFPPRPTWANASKARRRFSGLLCRLTASGSMTFSTTDR